MKNAASALTELTHSESGEGLEELTGCPAKASLRKQAVSRELKMRQPAMSVSQGAALQADAGSERALRYKWIDLVQRTRRLVWPELNKPKIG